MRSDSVGSDPSRIAHSRLYDLVCASPLIVAYGFACAGNIILMTRQWPSASDGGARLAIANEGAMLLFYGLQIVLCLFRRLPVGKSTGLRPRLIAVLAANFNFALLLLPREALQGFGAVLSAVLTLGGTAACLTILIYLGRSFSVFPEARKFVTRGPYRLVRHPLYLAEIVTTLGIMMQFRQPWAALIAAMTIALQIRRMRYEEDVLRRSFAAYDGYATHVARLLPGLY